MLPWLCLLVCAMATGCQGQTQGRAPWTGPAFQETACDLQGMAPDVASRLQCGTVSVPRDHDHPDEGVFALAVVIIHPRLQEPGAAPVLFIHGGPGSPLTAQAAQIARVESANIARNRELILLDQRGSGRSEPALCPNLAQDQLDVIARPRRTEEMLAAWHATYADCQQALSRDGIEPSWFGTSVTVRDIEILRQALGIARWNVYARSYGTEVAMTLQARHPETLRAVILDSVYPPDPLPLSRAQTFDAALGAMFRACAGDPACATAHPDLPKIFQETMDRLAQTPLTIPLTPFYQLSLSPIPFRIVVNQSLYFRPLLAYLPKVIQAVHDADTTFLRPVVGHQLQQFLATSWGDNAVVECRDRPSLQAQAVDRTQDGSPVTFSLQGICRNWITPGQPGEIALNTAIPTLLLAGEIDPITPPIFARLTADRLGPKARLITFPNVGHDVEESTPCGADIVTQFMRDPDAALNIDCVAKVAPVVFH